MSTAVKAPVCKCGAKARHIQMLTFSYDYCDACKAEVGGKAEPEPGLTLDMIRKAEKWNWGDLLASPAQALKAAYPPPVPPAPSVNPFPAVPSALPPGYVALKGEQVTCDACGYYCFNLPSDLSVGDPTGFGRIWNKDLVDEIHGASPKHSATGSCPNCPVGRFACSIGGKIHVKGRGWL